MASIRSIMDCIGVDTGQSLSVLRHLYGFLQSRVPADPCTAVTAEVSLLDHVRSLQSNHVHLNIIRVGIDNFTDAEVVKIDYAIYRARNIFKTVNLGVGRVEHYDVTSADSAGKDDLGSQDEAKDLTHDWSVPNDGLDVFMVDLISAGFIGLSPVGGTCDKDDKDMNGVIGGEVNRNSNGVARTFAHEIGHYLGLSHNHGTNCPTTVAGQNNLMAQTRCAISTCTSVLLTNSQGSTLRSHCSIQSGC